MKYVDWNDLLEATDNGLDIIEMFYPGAKDALHTRNKKFKIRNEKTASASIRQNDKGHYCVTDFGGDQKERNAIGICMLETGKEFPEAVQYLSQIFKVKGAEGNWKEIKPEWSTRPLKPEESAKDFFLEKKEFTENELKLLGPCVSAKHCADYNLISLSSFTYCKANEASVTASTEEYPIYAFDNAEWAKIYQPLSYKKEYRFRFVGKKPKRFIYGLQLLKSEFEKNKKKYLEDQMTYDGDDEETLKLEKKSDPRVDYVFIVSGGSDGLNLRSFGYIAVWFNSESETLNFEEYRLLQTYAKDIIYIPDLDATGIKQSVKTALTFLDIKIMHLPNYLSKRKDKRGNPCKDFKDFVVEFYDKKESKKFNSRLTKLIDNALPAQFWDKVPGKNSWKFLFRRTQFYNFLKLCGFGRVKDEYVKDGFHFVHIDGNVVRKVLPVEIEAFVHHFLKEREMPIALRDLIYATQLSQNALNKMDPFNIEFKTADKFSQYMFFNNGVLKISANEIELKKRGDVDMYIWKDKLLDHIIRQEESQFIINRDVHGNDDIIIKEKDNMFLNFLINTSRIHWRKELEENLKDESVETREAYLKKHKFDISGPNLDDDEQQEQKLHLINKIYALGYMLHTYKSPHRPWAVYAMDNKLSDLAESHGGSGKSIFQKAIQYILKKNHYIAGRDSKKTQDDFIYHGVTEDTDYIYIDDCHSNLDFGFFYNAITGDLEVNNKNGLRFVITFDSVPKFAFSSNYPPKNLDHSTARRLLFIVFSDYYHYNKDGEYNETRDPSNDFEGKTLFKDFDDKQWNLFYNFCAQCVQFYLSQNKKIDPPMGNVTMRNLLSEMGDNFKDWADNFFAKTDTSGEFMYLNRSIVKETIYEDLLKKTRLNYTPISFKRKTKAYCQYNEWVFNPETAQGYDAKNKRIMMKLDGVATEMFYIDTTGTKLNDAIEASSQTETHEADELDDELPFS